MRSEKGITLVALIGIFVLIVVLAGISISIAAKGNDDVQETTNDIVTNVGEVEDEEIVVDPTAASSITASEDVTTDKTTNTVTREVE